VNPPQRFRCASVEFVLIGTSAGQNPHMTPIEQVLAGYVRAGVAADVALAQLCRKGGMSRPAALKRLVDATVLAGVRGDLTPTATARRIRELALLHHGQTGVCRQLAVLVGLAVAWESEIPQRLLIEQKMLKELHRIRDAGGLQIAPEDPA
jgi:hypothetical protein